MRRASSRLVTVAAFLFLPACLPAQAFRAERFEIGGEGGMDYLSADARTGRVYVPRGTHVMVVDGATGTVVGDVRDTPRVHGVAFAHGMGFTTNAGDSSVTMFDLATLAVRRKIAAGIDGLDAIMYDESTDRILTINHSHVNGRAAGSAVVIDATTGTVVKTIALSGAAPEGGAGDGRGRIFINIEDSNSIDVIDTKTWTVSANWKIEPCEGPTGIAYDQASDRIFSGCSGRSVAVDARTGKVVAELPNGEGVDALGWDAERKLMYIPAGRSGNVTVYRQDSPDRYTLVETVATMRGARTIAVDPKAHRAYVFTPEYGPAPATPGQPAGRGARGPVVSAWLIAIQK